MKAILHKIEEVKNTNGLADIYSQEEITIPKKGSLEFMQRLVDGYIEVVSWQGKDLVVNEEGRLNGLPWNPCSRKFGINLVGNVIEIQGRLK